MGNGKEAEAQRTDSDEAECRSYQLHDAEVQEPNTTERAPRCWACGVADAEVIALARLDHSGDLYSLCASCAHYGGGWIVALTAPPISLLVRCAIARAREERR